MEDARGEEETKGKGNIKVLWDGHRRPFLNTKSFAHFVYRNDYTDLAANRMVTFFVFSDENHRKKDQFPIFGNHMKT